MKSFKRENPNPYIEKAIEEKKADDEDIILEGQCEDDFCTVCWVSELGSEPCIKLTCGHVFHLNCIKSIIEKRWTSFLTSRGTTGVTSVSTSNS